MKAEFAAAAAGQRGKRQYNDLLRELKCHSSGTLTPPDLAILPLIMPTDPPDARPSRAGMWIVSSVLLLAALMAGGNFLYQYLSTRDALQFWGREAAARFHSESKMTVALLEPADPEAEVDPATPTYTIGGARYIAGQSTDASMAGGNLHFRRALLQQRLYDWEHSPLPVPTQPAGSEAAPEWKYVVTFTDPDGETTLAFSADTYLVTMLNQPAGERQMLKLLPNEEGASPVAAFLAEQFSATGSGRAREF